MWASAITSDALTLLQTRKDPSVPHAETSRFKEWVLEGTVLSACYLQLREVETSASSKSLGQPSPGKLKTLLSFHADPLPEKETPLIVIVNLFWSNHRWEKSQSQKYLALDNLV